MVGVCRERVLIVRSRRLVHSGGRPLKLIVRRRGDCAIHADVVFVLVAPYLLLAAGGYLLWRRRHSMATMMVVLGFAAVLMAIVTSLFESIEYSALEPQGGLVIAHHRALTQAIHWAGLCGLWAASMGLVWHATHQR